MLSTRISCTSDYYSGSDLDYDGDDDSIVKAASSHYCPTIGTNIILQTLLHYHSSSSSSSSSLSSTIKVHQSLRLLKLKQEYDLSNEIFIRASVILHQFLLSTPTNDVDESILIACLSLSTKLTQHSNHSNIKLLNSNSLMINENIVCHALDWDIDMITAMNYVEAILLHEMDGLTRTSLRELSYELIVLCLTDVRCVDLSAEILGMGCLLMASELLNCCEVIPKQLFTYEQDKNISFETSLLYIRQVLLNILHR